MSVTRRNLHLVSDNPSAPTDDAATHNHRLLVAMAYKAVARHAAIFVASRSDDDLRRLSDAVDALETVQGFGR